MLFLSQGIGILIKNVSLLLLSILYIYIYEQLYVLYSLQCFVFKEPSGHFR